MKKGEYNKMSNSKQKVSDYEKILEQLRDIHRKTTNEFKTKILDMAQALKAEGKDEKATRRRMETDLAGIVSPSYVYKKVREVYETEEERSAKAEKEKKAEAELEANTDLVIEDEKTGTVLLSKRGNDGNEQKLSPQEERDLLKKNPVTKGTIKGSGQISKTQREQPTKDESELDGDDDDDNDDISGNVTTSYEPRPPADGLKPHGNSLHIEDPIMIKDILTILNKGQSLIITFDKDCEPESVRAGQLLKVANKA